MLVYINCAGLVLFLMTDFMFNLTEVHALFKTYRSKFQINIGRK